MRRRKRNINKNGPLSIFRKVNGMVRDTSQFKMNAYGHPKDPTLDEVVARMKTLETRMGQVIKDWETHLGEMEKLNQQFQGVEALEERIEKLETRVRTWERALFEMQNEVQYIRTNNDMAQLLAHIFPTPNPGSIDPKAFK